MIIVALNIVAIGAFLIGLVGLGWIVKNVSDRQSVRGGILLTIAGFLLGTSFLIIAQGLLIVGPTERVVVFNTLSGELETPRDPGLHIILPAIQYTYPYLVSNQVYTMSNREDEGSNNINDAINARSIDGQQVSIDITILFRIDPADVNMVHRNWSTIPQGYVDGFIRPTLRSLTRNVIATARAEEIFGSVVIATDDVNGIDTQANIRVDPTTGFAFPNPSPSSRAEVQAEIERQAALALAEEGFTVIDILLSEINFSEEFIQAIEDRQVAELDLERADIQADTVRIEASGLANARIEEARGEAEVVRTRAEAEAEALRLISEQIAANPNLIQYRYVTELSDTVSLVLVPSNSPFLFDASTFINLGDDFSASE